MKQEYSNKSYMCIGDISISLFSESKEFINYIQKWYKEFLIDEINSDLNLSIYEVPADELNAKKFPNPENVDIKFNKEKNILYINSNRFIGEFKIDQMEATLKCSHYLYFNPFLRIIFAMALLKDQGFLIHAAGMINNGNGYVFPGQSGAGKSTISKISNNSTILTDELVLIKKIDNKFIMYGTPFWGEYEKAHNKSTEIKGIYFLKKDKINSLEHLNQLMAIKMLLPNIFFFRIDKEFTNIIFNLCNEFIHKIPSYELHFKLDPTFWRLIDAK